MMNKIIYIILLISLLNHAAYCQDKVKVIAAVSEDNSGIIVKWYGEFVYFDEAVNLYRTEEGTESWIPVNSSPISKKEAIDPSLFAKDDLFKNLDNILKGKKSKEIEGFMRLVLVVKSVEYPEFSDYLGIQFIDKNASKGKSYLYKLTFASNEKVLGISEPVSYTQYKPLDPPDSVRFEINKYVPLIGWEPAPNKYFGYAVYRSENGGESVKISPQPIIPSKDERGKYAMYHFHDDTMQVGRKFIYNVYGLDYFGRESEASRDLVIEILDKTPPPAPYLVKPEVTGKTVQLYWENMNADDLAGFHIYRSNDQYGDYKPVHSGVIPKDIQIYLDTVSQTGVVYYKVASVDEAGNEGISYSVPAEILDVFPPAAPVQVICKADTGKIHLSWKANTETDLMGYYIFRTIDRGVDSRYMLLNANPVLENQYTDILPKEAKNKFFYKIVAVDTSYNRSQMSRFAQATMPDVMPPKKPVIKLISVEENALVIEWFPNPESDLEGYSVYRRNREDSLSKPEKLNTSYVKISLFTDRFPEPGTAYEYMIAATDSAGNESAYSDPFPGILPGKKTSEAGFSGFTAKYQESRKGVYLKWKVKTNDKYKGVIIYKKEGENNVLKPITGLIMDSEYTDKDYNPETYNSYQLRLYTLDNQIIKTEEIEIK